MSKNSFSLSVSIFLGIWMYPLTASEDLSVGIRVIDESAIPYTAFLSKAAFDQRFPGQIKSDPTVIDSGWYVIYEHENLSYYFGPIALQSVGQDYLSQLTEIVDTAIEQRPDIKGYRIELRFEPSDSLSAETGEKGDADEDYSGTESSKSEQSHPKPTGLWRFIRSIFGL